MPTRRTIIGTGLAAAATALLGGGAEYFSSQSPEDAASKAADAMALQIQNKLNTLPSGEGWTVSPDRYTGGNSIGSLFVGRSGKPQYTANREITKDGDKYAEKIQFSSDQPLKYVLEATKDQPEVTVNVQPDGKLSSQDRPLKKQDAVMITKLANLTLTLQESSALIGEGYMSDLARRAHAATGVRLDVRGSKNEIRFETIPENGSIPDMYVLSRLSGTWSVKPGETTVFAYMHNDGTVENGNARFAGRAKQDDLRLGNYPVPAVTGKDGPLRTHMISISSAIAEEMREVKPVQPAPGVVTRLFRHLIP